MRLRGPQSRSGRRGEEEILDPTGIRTLDFSVVQPVASRFIDYAIPARQEIQVGCENWRRRELAHDRFQWLSHIQGV
jgi:hypothetical protein